MVNVVKNLSLKLTFISSYVNGLIYTKRLLGSWRNWYKDVVNVRIKSLFMQRGVFIGRYYVNLYYYKIYVFHVCKEFYKISD